MFMNDYPLSMYDEDMTFIVDDIDDGERFVTQEQVDRENKFKRFIALVGRS